MCYMRRDSRTRKSQLSGTYTRPTPIRYSTNTLSNVISDSSEAGPSLIAPRSNQVWSHSAKHISDISVIRFDVFPVPMKPTVSQMTVGETEGIKLIFGEPEEGKCPTVKVFYSPGLNGIPIKPEFYKLGEVLKLFNSFYETPWTLHVVREN